MRHNINKLSEFVIKQIIAVTLTCLLIGAGTLVYGQQTPAAGTSKIWGTVNGIAIEGVVEGPESQISDLQVACVFEYTEGDIFNAPPALPAALNGMVQLDQNTKGLITGLRKSGKFSGHAYETILMNLPKGTIGGKRLLLIGLGDRNKFSADIMYTIGSVAMREALKIGVNNFSFSSDLKDGGIDSPTALVASNVVKGMFQAYRTQLWLKDQKMDAFKPVTKVILLAGPSFFTVAGGGIQEAITSLKNQ